MAAAQGLDDANRGLVAAFEPGVVDAEARTQDPVGHVVDAGNLHCPSSLNRLTSTGFRRPALQGLWSCGQFDIAAIWSISAV